MALGPASRSSFAPVISLLELISLLERRSGRCARGRLAIAAFAILLPLPAAVQASAGESTVPAVHHRLPPVLFGPLSHSGLTRMGAAPTGFRVTLQLGLVANLRGMANAARAASDPSSPSYGTYLTLAQLRQRFGAPGSRQAAVLRALRAVGARVT